jgi:hypothetical protein
MIHEANIKTHVIKKLYERFGLSITNEEYDNLNSIVESTASMYPSTKDLNCDFREILFRDKKIICIFDNQVNKIKTVLLPLIKVKDNNQEIFKGKIATGRVISQTNYGFFVLYEDKYLALLTNEEAKSVSKINIDDILYFRILNNPSKHPDENQIFLRIAKMIDYIPK